MADHGVQGRCKRPPPQLECRRPHPRFPEIAAAVAKLRPDIHVLDGEVAVFDEKLVSRFPLLGDSDTGVLCTPPMFIAFDVLQVGRHDVRALPLVRRRSILEDAIRGEREDSAA